MTTIQIGENPPLHKKELVELRHLATRHDGSENSVARTEGSVPRQGEGVDADDTSHRPIKTKLNLEKCRVRRGEGDNERLATTEMGGKTMTINW